MGIGTAYGKWSPESLDKLPPAILACGPESSLKQEMVDQLKDQFPADNREILSVYAHESTPDDVVRELRSQGLFNESKWVILKQLELDESGQAELSRYYDALTEYLDDPHGDSLLILFDEAHPYQKGRRTGGIARSVEEAGGEAVVFWEPFEREMYQRIRSMFQESGVEWESGVIERIVEKTKGKFSRIEQEVEKLIDFAGEEPLDPAVVERVVSSEEAADAYQALKDAIVTGSVSTMIAELDDFYRQSTSGEEVAIAHVTISFLHDLREIQRGMRTGQSLEEAMEAQGIPTSQGIKKKHKQALNSLRDRFPKDFFRKGYRLLKDVKYRGDPMNRRSLEQFMLETVPTVMKSPVA